MNRPRVSARALIVENGSVLVSCYEDARGPWYVLPGGGQRNGEPLRTCLVREAREEASAEISVGRLRWVREFISANHADSTLDPDFHQVELFFECELVEGSEVRLGEAPDIGQEESMAREDILLKVSERLAEVVDELSDKERDILQSRLLSDSPDTLQDNGDRYGVSRERIRQIETQLKKRLAELLGDIQEVDDVW